MVDGAVVLVVSGFVFDADGEGVLGVPIGSIVYVGRNAEPVRHHFNWDFMGTIARSMPQLGLLMILGHCYRYKCFPAVPRRASMPQAVQDIMLTMPTTHFVSLSEHLILYRGAGLSIVRKLHGFPDPAGGVGGVFFLIALLRFRRNDWHNGVTP